MHVESSFHIAPNLPYIGKITIMSQIPNMKSLSIFFNFVLFLLSSLVAGPNFMSISLLIKEL